MNKIEPEKDSISLSVEKIIDLIRSLRNELIKEFLKDESLLEYYHKHFKKKLSIVKKEFIKRELRELLISPVDLVHYAGLINHIKETSSASIGEKDSEYFYSDLKRIIAKYEH
jgi:hypothetical protein